MKKEQIKHLFEQFENACYDYNGIECWSARELQSIFNYAEWRNFLKIVNKVKEACENSGTDVSNHFVGANKMVELGSGSKREIDERGVDDKGFAIIRNKGDQALFGGFGTHEMKRKLQVPANRPLADFLPTLTIKAKDFATELTSHNVIEKDLRGENSIAKEHVDNNLAVRKMLIQRGVKPEGLPPANDVKKVQRKLDKEKKTAQINPKGIKSK